MPVYPVYSDFHDIQRILFLTIVTLFNIEKRFEKLISRMLEIISIPSFGPKCM